MAIDLIETHINKASSFAAGASGKLSIATARKNISKRTLLLTLFELQEATKNVEALIKIIDGK
jgi:hypothetical protein